jgi:hypothetical protein
MMSTRLWLLVLVYLLCTDLAYAQTITGTDTQAPPTSTAENDSAPSPPREEATQPAIISFFRLQSQRFAHDVQRQITDFILPVSVGEHLLNTLQYQAITPRVKAHILLQRGLKIVHKCRCISSSLAYLLMQDMTP